MSHRIILNRTTDPNQPSALGSVGEPAYTFEYTPPHALTPAESGAQFAKIQRLLERAVAVADDPESEE